MPGDFLNTPHPHLRNSILYVVDVPKRIKWHHLASLFAPCGAVTSHGRDTVQTNQGQVKRLSVEFSDTFHAEMALATLQGAAVPGVSPLFNVELTWSPQLEKAAHREPLFPQYVRYSGHEADIHPSQQASAQDVFSWFRHAGPLVSVRVNEDVGWPHPTCTVQYWDIPHAQHARLNCRTLHPALQEMPSFQLRTYDPRNLYCAGLGKSFTVASLLETFSKFGNIVEGCMKKTGVPESFGFISFITEAQASCAMKAMNGSQLEGRAIIVRLHEPNNQAVFRLPPAARQAQKPETGASPASAAHEEERKRDEAVRQAQDALRKKEKEAAQKKAQEEAQKKAQEEAQKKAREEAERKAKEAERLRREAEKREEARRAARENLRRAAAKKEREKVERLAEHASKELEDAAAERQAAQEQVDAATLSHHDTKDRWVETDEAVREAERALQAAKARRQEAAQASIEAVRRKAEAENVYRGANLRFEQAQKEDIRLRTWREAAIREEAEALKGSEAADEEAKEKEEQRRQAELAESIRKLKEIREQEEADRQEILKREQEEKDLENRRREAERLAQEERERKEREERAREERELLERKIQEARRHQAYLDASQRERVRCRDRDNISWAPRMLWTKERAINRFKAVSTEFDGIKFCDIQPLTFESVPWPLIHSPLTMKLDDIEWSAVEEFFKATELAVDAAEYRSLVEKAHRRFHPDKWRARGLLLTVLDEDLRQRLEDAGNVVAQAITPIWLASKSKK